MSPTTRLATSLLAVTFVAFAAPGALAEAPSATIGPGFDHVELQVPKTTLDVYPETLGVPRSSAMMGCNMDNRVTTKDPIVTFRVSEPTAAILTIEGAPKGFHFTGAAVMLPGRRILCIKDSNRYQSQVWPVGDYAIHFVATGNLTYDGLLPVDVPDGGMKVVFHELTPRSAALDVTTGPNPTHFDGLRHDRRDQSVGNWGVSCKQAAYTTERPAMIFDLAAPAKRLRVSIDGGSEAVIITDANGRSACSDKVWLARDYLFVDLEDDPAGKLEVRTAGHLRGGSREESSDRHVWYAEPFDRPTFSIAVEDLTRPRDVAWTAETAPPTLALAGPMTELWSTEVPAPTERPVALNRHLDAIRIPMNPGSHVRELGSCAGFTRSEVPAVILEARRPMTDAWYRAVSNRPLKLVLAGPFGDDGRPADGYREQCMTAGLEPRAGFGRLDMAEYRVFLAQPKDAEPDRAVLVIGTQETPTDPMKMYRTPASDLAVADKALLPYFAMLPIDGNWFIRWSHFTPFQRQDLIAKAPLTLFAYPKFDLDKASASYWGVDQRALDAAGVPVTYPVTDEPLLVLEVSDKGRAQVMTADANMLSIDVKYLAAAPAGPPKVPTEVRNLIISWEDVVRWQTPEDAKAVARVEKARDKADACYSEYWSKHHGGVSGRLSLVTYVNGRVTSVRDYTDMVDKRATARCGLARVDKLQASVLKKLDKRLRKRGAEQLAIIAKRFTE